MKDTIILGAGVTGLAAGIATQGTIYEAKDVPGGLCRSYRKNGYHFDIGGGHWIFGFDKVGRFLSDFDAFNTYSKHAGVYINKIFTGSIQAYEQEAMALNTMKHSLSKKFSPDLCRFFFFPFNEKYTAGLYDSISAQDEYKSPAGHQESYNDIFAYPAKGLDNLVDFMAWSCPKVVYNKRAVTIDGAKQIVFFSDGSTVHYERLVSTLPLNNLLNMVGIENNLLFTGIYSVNIGAGKGPNYPSYHWLYIPFCKSGFFRVGFYSNVDQSFAPQGKCALYVETAFSEEEEQPCVDELQEWGFIKEPEVVDNTVIPVAYTWLRPGETVDGYLDLLKQKNIYSIGRYGRWHFQGIADSILEGLSLGYGKTAIV